MVIEEDTEIGRKCKIIDFNGNYIRRVKSFDTETKLAEMYVKLENGQHAVIWEDDITSLTKGGRLKLVTIKCNLIGARAIDKRTGEEIK